MNEFISRAIIKTLDQCGPGRSLPLDALCTYANAHLSSYAGREQIQEHVNEMERLGYVRREARPLAPDALAYSITATGHAVALTLI
jgi:DNA-binding HxlR family transcriptional regulator